MPFTETRHGNTVDPRIITKRQWDHIYERWIKRAVESYPETSFNCKRSPAKPGNFIKGIINDIASADLVIADLTGGRPNVYYELGIRHALRTGSIIITQHLNALPSDLASYFAFEYSYSEKDFEYETRYAEFEASLHKNITELENAIDPSDSPVSDFLGLRHQLLERTLEDEKREFRWLLENIGEVLVHNYRICEEMYAAIIKKKDVEFSTIPVIDLFPMEALYTRLFSVPWRIHKPKVLQNLAELLTYQRRLFQVFSRVHERASFGAQDDKAVAEAFVTMTDAIKNGRKHFEKAWKDVLRGKIEYKLVWEKSKTRTQRRSASSKPEI